VSGIALTRCSVKFLKYYKKASQQSISDIIAATLHCDRC